MNTTVIVTEIPRSGKTTICSCEVELARASAVLIDPPVKIVINAEVKREEAAKEIPEGLEVG